MHGRAVGTLAGLFFLVLLLPSLSPHYGFYSDELYYLACADRLAFGYVDHPPFFVWVLHLHRAIFGESLFALRVLPAAAGAATAFLTGFMAWQLGGGRYAQLLAPLALMVGQSLVLFSFFSVNCLGLLFWTGASCLLIERCRSGNPRLWLALALVLGVAFLTKHTIAVFMAGLGVAVLLSPTLRRDLGTPWPWLAALFFLMLAAPNLAWQWANDWVSLDFYRQHAEDNLPISALAVLAQQIVAQNPATLPIWGAGLFFLLRSERGRDLRPLGVVFLVVFGLAMAGGQSVPYRIAGVFPLAFAAGAVWIESRRRPAEETGPLRRAWNTWTLPAVLVAFGMLAASIGLPLLPPDQLRSHPLNDGDEWRRVVGEQRLPYHLGNRTHWPALTEDVAQVTKALAPEELDGAIILADYFGHAGALEYYGRDLPPVYGYHTGYYLWGPPAGSPDPIIAVGVDPALLRAAFREVRVARVFRCRNCPGWQDELPIHVAKGAARPFSELWRELGERRGMDFYRRRIEAAESP